MLARGVAGLAIVVALVASACSSGSGESDSASAASAPKNLDGLRGAIAGLVDYEFDLSVFVVDGAVATTGPRRRPYAFDSITKTITALVLARLVELTDLELSTPVGSLLRAGPNADITLEQLATHTAGLPRLAPNSDDWPGFDPRNPYRGYTAEMAEAALRGVEREGVSEYSNFGFQLLGLALERFSGRRLGDLAHEFVFAAASMTTASIPQRRGVLPDGLHDGRPAPGWDEQLGGAGGAIGTIADLAGYASTMLNPPDALRPAVEAALLPRALSAAGRTGLAWITTRDLTWHNGGSAAYSSLVVLDRRNNRAAGFLAATGDLDGKAEDLVFRYLESQARGDR